MTDAPARFFTAGYAEHATLRDGTPIVLRLLTPEDKSLLQEGFERLSAESRYARFFSPKLALTADELRYLCEIDQENHFAIGAVRADGDDDGDGPDDGRGDGPNDGQVGLGIARFIRLAEPPATAEAAITVADEAQGRGLGKP